MANSNASKPLTEYIGTGLTGSTNEVLEYVEPTAVNGQSVESLGVGCPAPAALGSITATGDITAFYSDDRLKNVLGTIPDALNKVMQLSGVYYTGNDVAAGFGYDSSTTQVGVLASEVQSVLPEVVKPAPFDIAADGSSISGEHYRTVQYERIVPLLIEAIKELKAEIDVLKGN